MAFEVANEAFEKAFGSAEKSDKELLGGFIQMLSNYLRGRKEWSAVVMRRWIRDGGSLYAFRCREDAAQTLIDSLVNKGVPFVLVKDPAGATGFLIRKEDIFIAKTTIGEVLALLSRYCEVTTGEQAGIYYRKSKEKDKTMLLLCGLSKEEVYYLKEEARETLPGMAVGIDQMPDGTYMVTCHGKSAFDDNSGSFLESLMTSRLIANGESSPKLSRRMENRDEYIKAKTAGFPDMEGTMDSPVWIVGDGEKYVKRGADGFEAGHAEESAGEIVLAKEMDVMLSDSLYEMRMNSALSAITGHICLYSISDVLEHFQKKKNAVRDIKETGQKRLVSTASQIVTEKEAFDTKNKKAATSWKKKMERYQTDMGTLMTAAKEGTVPAGYTKNDVLKLRRIIRKFGLDMEKAAPGIGRMSSIQVFERKAGPALVKDVEKLLVSYRGENLDIGAGMMTQDLETGLGR